MKWINPVLISRTLCLLALGVLGLSSAASFAQDGDQASDSDKRPDLHSYANPNEVRVQHMELYLNIDFERRVLSGTVELHIENLTQATELVLDTNGLKIDQVTTGRRNRQTEFTLSEADPILGQKLSIKIHPLTKKVKILYETSPQSEGLQWLAATQTKGGKTPFLYSQSQSIFARTWIPLQDTPLVRATFNAQVQTDREDVLVLMGASNPQSKEGRGGYFEFSMPQPIPSYLMALTAGNIEFKEFNEKAGIYAEPETLPKAHAEFEPVKRMIEVAEKLAGPYPWERYDMITMPPSFPFGGMENPRLTFLNPSIIVGDQSLVSLVAHELAHSWTGNLITNATWEHFWLNEGWTTWFERRIIEEMYGRDAMELQAQEGLNTLLADLKSEPRQFTYLKLNLKNTDPEDSYNNVPYEKGYLFLRMLEEEFGREAFDLFFKKYLDKFRFKSITTEQFETFLEEELLKNDLELKERLEIRKWLYEPGLPEKRPKIISKSFAKVGELFAKNHGEFEKSDIERLKEFTTFEWLYFFSLHQTPVNQVRLQWFEDRFNFSKSENPDIRSAWLQIGLENNHQTAWAEIEAFLKTTGRGKFVIPLFEKLNKTPAGKQLAFKILDQVEDFYHVNMVAKVKSILNNPTQPKDPNDDGSFGSPGCESTHEKP